MLRTAPIFSDNMVLQRNKRICVFGQADEGSRITVSMLGKTAEAVCRNGKWLAYLPASTAAQDVEMEISDGKDVIFFKGIAIGEVWLAGGQSNMELELQNARGGEDILKQGKEMLEETDRIRFYYTPKVAYECEELWEAEKNAHWETFQEKDAAKWSATAFFFAKELAEKITDVTIGIIGCNWGGTSASAWMSREALMEQTATQSYIEEYESSDEVKKTKEEQIQDYRDYLIYHADWEAKAADIYGKEPMMPFDKVQEIIGVCQYPGPMNCANFTRPCGLYEVMLKKAAPYSLRGFIYYQGESDEHKPDSYYALFTRMMRQWREEWQDDTLPFLMVQLPMHRYQHDPDTKSWCLLREAQMKAYDTVKHTGIAVIIDCGEFHEIHPKNKKPVGKRLALQALCHVYHRIEEKEAFGPLYQDFLYRDGGMEIRFAYAEKGFKIKGEQGLLGFELAGADGEFYPARAELLQAEDDPAGRSSIFLSAQEVKNPVMARYLWTNYGEVTLFGDNGLPVAPFRTHRF